MLLDLLAALPRTWLRMFSWATGRAVMAVTAMAITIAARRVVRRIAISSDTVSGFQPRDLRGMKAHPERANAIRCVTTGQGESTSYTTVPGLITPSLGTTMIPPRM